MRSRIDFATRMQLLNVPLYEKSCLSLEEASAYTGIGMNKLRELTNDPECNFVLWVGTRRLLKRRKLDEFIDEVFSV